jgi:hypothetical protein
VATATAKITQAPTVTTLPAATTVPEDTATAEVTQAPTVTTSPAATTVPEDTATAEVTQAPTVTLIPEVAAPTPEITAPPEGTVPKATATTTVTGEEAQTYSISGTLTLFDHGLVGETIVAKSTTDSTKDVAIATTNGYGKFTLSNLSTGSYDLYYRVNVQDIKATMTSITISTDDITNQIINLTIVAVSGTVSISGGTSTYNNSTITFVSSDPTERYSITTSETGRYIVYLRNGVTYDIISEDYDVTESTYTPNGNKDTLPNETNNLTLAEKTK